jgi:hypothetical protein
MSDYATYDELRDADRARRGNGHANGTPLRFRIEPFDGIEIGSEPEWRVQDIVPSYGIMLFVGEPGCGKSFLAADLGLHITLGKAWAGKAVVQGAVIYITGEGANGFRKRLTAFRQHHRPKEFTPFYFIADAPDLGHADGDVKLLIARIRQQVDAPLVLIVLDTLATMMKGADENLAADASIFISNCSELGKAFGCTIAAVHHVGKDATRGARGSSVLKAAADIEITVQGTEGERTAVVSKSKDGEAGLALRFTLERLEIAGTDQSSCVLSIVSPWQQGGSASRKVTVTGHAKIALDALRQAIDEAGQIMPASSHRPNIRGCSEAIWRRYCEQVQVTATNTPDAKRMAFKRSAERLQALGLIGFWNEWVWIVQ